MSRLPLYLQALTTLAEEGVATVSSEELAAAAGVGSAKLRKDLSHLGRLDPLSHGRRFRRPQRRVGRFLPRAAARTRYRPVDRA